MTVAIDMFGGDHAPHSCMRGVHLFIKDHPKGVVFLFCGKPDITESLAIEYRIPADCYRIIPAPEVIAMEEVDAPVIRQKTNSSLFVALQLLASQQADAMISAGNSKALMLGIQYYQLNTSKRPVAPAWIPQTNGRFSILADAGLNPVCRAEDFVEFARLTSTFAHQYLHLARPRLALLNIGSEAGKGRTLEKEAEKLLGPLTYIDFVGNVEGNQLLKHRSDIFITDGFTGNVVLKLLESMSGCNPRFLFDNYGGSYLLGVKYPIILGHGRSGADAFQQMIACAVNGPGILV